MGFGLKKIRWNNAFIFSGEYSLEFPPHGLILLEGKNLDAGGSNGAGKTSFLNLIPTALFEENASGLIKDKLIHKMHKSAFIELTLDNGIRVLYERGKGVQSSTWEVYKNGQVLKRETLRETKDIILELIDIDYIQYTSAIHLCQNSTLGFFMLSGSEKLNLLTKMLRLDKYDIASQISKNKFDSLKIEKEKFEQLLYEIKLQREQLDLEVQQLEQKSIMDLNQIEQELVKSEREIAELKDIHKVLYNDFVNAKLILDGITREKARIEREVRVLEAKLLDVQKVANEFVVIRNKLQEFDARIKEYDKIKAKIKEITEREDKLKEQLNNFNTEISILLHEIDELERIGSLSIGDVCPVCGREIDPVLFKSRKEEIEDKVKLNKNKIKNLKLQYQDGVEQLDNLKRERKKLELAIEEMERIKTEKAVYEERLRRDVEQEINEYKSQIDGYEKQLLAIEDEYKIKAEQLKMLEAQIKENDYKLAEKNKILMELIQKKAEGEKRAELVRILTSKREELNKRYIELETQINLLNEQMEYYKWWIDGFKKFKILEIYHAIEILQSLLNKYIELLFENRLFITIDVFKFKKTKKTEFDFKNEINVSVNNGEIPIEGFSGGERQLMGLAMLLALNDFFGMKFILLDEVFGSLDMVNRERVLKLLESLRNEKLVIVVTHLEEIKSAIDWDFYYIIERKNGSSSFYIERTG